MRIPDPPSSVWTEVRARLSGGRRGHRVPCVHAHQVSDCGTACLTMVLRYLGDGVSLLEVERQIGTGRDGISALRLVEGARRFGLRGRAVRTELADLKYLTPGTSILHWNLYHFVVLERATARGCWIVDPLCGRRHASAEECDCAFTGIAILLEPGEGFTRRPQSRSFAWTIVKKTLVHSRLLARIILLSVAAQLIGLALPLMTGSIVDRVVPRADITLLTILTIGALGVTAVGFVTVLIRSNLLLELRTLMDARLSADFLEHLLKLPLPFFMTRQSGDLLLRLNNNTVLRELLTAGVLSALLDGSLVVLYLLLMLHTHLFFALITIAFAAMRLGLYFATRGAMRDVTNREIQTQTKLANYQVEMVSGIETLKAAGAEWRAAATWSDRFVDVLNASIARGQLNTLVTALFNVMGSASPLLLLCYGAQLVITEQMSLGTMLAMNALAAGFFAPLTSLVSTGITLQGVESYVARMEDVLASPAEQDTRNVAVAPTLRGEIELRNVSFRYPGASTDVIRDVDLRIEPGMKVGIVGRSGSGKSTLARLLIALLEPTAGEVLVDGVPLRSLDYQSVRKQVGYVPQNPWIFGGTLRDYIALGDPALGFADIVRAAQQACIHDEITNLPLQYDTQLVAGATSLSGGQRQRVALARALAGAPVIVLLDEATSHLDIGTDDAVQRNLAALRCTRIVVAHRIQTVSDSDLICVVEDGAIVQRGTHSELAHQAGPYADVLAIGMETVT